jgi:hypothetical protein
MSGKDLYGSKIFLAVNGRFLTLKPADNPHCTSPVNKLNSDSGFTPSSVSLSSRDVTDLGNGEDYLKKLLAELKR